MFGSFDSKLRAAILFDWTRHKSDPICSARIACADNWSRVVGKKEFGPELAVTWLLSHQEARTIISLELPLPSTRLGYRARVRPALACARRLLEAPDRTVS